MLVEENGDPGAATSELSADVRKAVAARAKSVGYKAKKGATLSVQTTSGDVLVCAVSSGDGASEALRRAAGKAKQAAAAVRAGAVTFCAGSAKSAAARVEPIAEGFLLSSYRFDKYKSSGDDRYDGPKTVTIAGSGLDDLAAARADLEHAQVCLLYTSPSPRDKRQSRMPSSA